MPMTASFTVPLLVVEVDAEVCFEK